MSTEARRPAPPVRPPHDPPPSAAPRSPQRGETEQATGSKTPPPPAATARFPDTSPSADGGLTAAELTDRHQ
ncbi:hypothetical protein AB0E65_23875, partial [Streptomyces fragilis]